MKCRFELSEELRQTPFLLSVHKVRKGFFLGKKKKMALHIIFSASCFVFFTLLLIECIQMKNSVLFTYVRQKKTFHRHQKSGLGSGICTKVNNFLTISLTDCSCGVCGINVKMSQFGPLEQ